MKTWVCEICGYSVEAENPPDVCPVCGADKEKFSEKE
jgi:rubrerythrin